MKNRNMWSEKVIDDIKEKADIFSDCAICGMGYILHTPRKLRCPSGVPGEKPFTNTRFTIKEDEK